MPTFSHPKLAIIVGINCIINIIYYNNNSFYSGTSV